MDLNFKSAGFGQKKTSKNNEIEFKIRNSIANYKN